MRIIVTLHRYLKLRRIADNLEFWPSKTDKFGLISRRELLSSARWIEGRLSTHREQSCAYLPRFLVTMSQRASELSISVSSFRHLRILLLAFYGWPSCSRPSGPEQGEGTTLLDIIRT